MNKFINNALLINIYQYDSTYHDYFKLAVLPFLKKNYYIKWQCKKTLVTDIMLSEYPGLTTSLKTNNSEIYKYTFLNCKKKCKFYDNKFSGFKHYPFYCDY